MATVSSSQKLTFVSLSFFYLFFGISTTNSIHALDFENFITLFESCTINLYVYNNFPVIINQVPVSIYSNVEFEIKTEYFVKETLSSKNCLALFYILPMIKSKKKGNRGDRYPDYYGPPKYKGPRYDILIDNNDKKMYSKWVQEYNVLLESEIPSHGLLLSVGGIRLRLQLQNQVMIINKLRLTTGKYYLSSKKISDILNIGARKALDKAIAEVNDLSKNEDVPWILMNQAELYAHLVGGGSGAGFLNSLKGGTTAQRIKDLMKHGDLIMTTSAEYLTPHSVSTEGQENYVFAFMALGTNITLAPSPFGRGPSILFNVKDEVIMSTEGSGLGYLSCFSATARLHYTSIFIVVAELLSIFQPNIYAAMGATYLLPILLLGSLYHFVLKRKIQKKYWVKWHPFTWGMRALILQPGDRILNKQRFGWTIWMVGPWMLMAVILTHAFLFRNLKVLWEPSVRRIPWTPSLDFLYERGVTIVTDDMRLQREPQMKIERGLSQYRDIGEMLQQNSSIAFVTAADRVDNVAKAMGADSKSLWARKVCSGWQPLLRRRIWYPPYFIQNRNARAIFLEEQLGWRLSKWGDDRVIKRLKVLEGSSGIVTKWREILRGNRGDGMYGYSWIGRVSMEGNFRYCFYVALGSLAVGLAVWIVELAFFKAWVQPKRKRILRRNMELAKSREVTVINDCKVDDPPGGNDDGNAGNMNDEFKAETVSLAAGTTSKTGSATSTRSRCTNVEVEGVINVAEYPMSQGKKSDTKNEENSCREDLLVVKCETTSLNEYPENEAETTNKKEDDEFDCKSLELHCEDDGESALGTDLDTLEVGSDFEVSENEERSFNFTVNPTPPPGPTTTPSPNVVNNEGDISEK